MRLDEPYHPDEFLPDPIPVYPAPELSVWWDDDEPIGTLLGPDGEPLRVVMPPRQPLGFQHPRATA